MSEPAREVRQIESTGAWLDWRREDLTASRIPALWDLHPYLSREQLREIMRGSTSAGSSSPPDNSAMRRGRIFEAAVAAAITEERPDWTITKATTYHRIPSLRIGCTPDYFATSTLPKEPGRGIIQIKTAAPRVWERWQGRAPLPYVIQTLTEAVVCECSWAWLVIMVMSESYPVHYFAVARHPQAEARIIAAAAEWWRAFDADEPHARQDSAELAEMLDDGSHIDLSADNELPSLLAERAALAPVRRDAEQRIDAIDATIKERMGTAATGWLPGYHITYRTAIRKAFSVPEKTVRTLRVRAVDEQESINGKEE